MSIPPSLRAGLRGGFTGEELMKKGLGTGGVTARPVWPRWLLDKLGKAAIAELNAKAASDIAIVNWPERLKKYLKNLDAQEPGVQAKTQEIYQQIHDRLLSAFVPKRGWRRTNWPPGRTLARSVAGRTYVSISTEPMPPVLCRRLGAQNDLDALRV